jgi:signal transduction histidine kinase/FixJ family two-component response regulator
MDGKQASPSVPADDRCRSALDCALRWLSNPDSASLSLTEMLADLARAFAASAAGIAQLPGGEPVARSTPIETPLPWQQHPELLRDLAGATIAQTFRQDGVHWLLSVIDGDAPANGLLWLAAPATREWSSDEAAALTLTGQALARHLSRRQDAPRWARQLHLQHHHQRFEEAAAAGRRILHDFGNVLTGLLGFSELALGLVPQNHPVASYLSEIQRAGQRGERLTQALSLFTRRHWPEAPPARLAAVIAEEQRRIGGKTSGVSYEVNIPSDLPNVAIGVEPLRHIVAQLFDNAVEAAAPRPNIKVSARSRSLTAEQCLDLFGVAEPGSYVEVAVVDNGSGLSPEVCRRLLVEPFFTTKTRQRGYGLAVVHGILVSHRGALAIEPLADGTAARVYLPLASVPATVAGAEPTTSMTGERVLVVDDDPLVLKLAQATLQRAGFSVETAANADEALRTFCQAAQPFALVLSDVVMPRVNGYDLARQLQSHDPHVNLLFMSGEQMSDAVRRPVLNAAFQLLAKPFAPDGLLQAVCTALQRDPRRASVASEIRDEAVQTPTR